MSEVANEENKLKNNHRSRFGVFLNVINDVSLLAFMNTKMTDICLFYSIYALAG